MSNLFRILKASDAYLARLSVAFLFLFVEKVISPKYFAVYLLRNSPAFSTIGLPSFLDT